MSKFAGEAVITIEHVGNAATLGTGQPSGNESRALRKLVGNEQRSAGNHDHDDRFAGIVALVNKRRVRATGEGRIGIIAVSLGIGILTRHHDDFIGAGQIIALLVRSYVRSAGLLQSL